jgi:hypothetical protein
MIPYYPQADAPTIQLTWYEIMMAALAGTMRHVENLKKNRKPAYGAGHERDWQIDIEGCLGECALAKYLGLYWSGKGTFRGSDVGKFEVRTAAKQHYKLILHPTDDDDKIFWLACGLNGNYTIKGWILAKDGKKEEYWGDNAGNNRPAYWVPQSELKPLQLLEVS